MAKHSEKGADRDPKVVKDEEDRAVQKQRERLEAVLHPSKKSKKDE
jgi:hypothetical protein